MISDQDVQAVNSYRNCRRTMAHHGPLDAVKVVAAERYTALGVVEPWWVLWMAADLSVAPLAWMLPLPIAHIVTLVYGIVFAIDMFRSKNIRRRLVRYDALIHFAPSDNADAAQRAFVINRTVIWHAVYGAAVASVAAVSTILISPVFQICWSLYGLVAWYGRSNRLRGMWLAKRVLREAKKQDWYPEYAEMVNQRWQAAEIAGKL